MELSAEVTQTLITTLSGIVIALVPLLLILARRCAQYLAKLADTKLSEDHLRQLDHAVEAGILYAEEQARKRLLGAAGSGPSTGAEKLEVAKSAARSMAPAALADVGDQQLEMNIEARLSRVRPSLARSSYPPASPPPPSLAPHEMYPPAPPTPLPPLRRP